MADYGMDPPSNSIVSVAGEGELEMQLSFTRVDELSGLREYLRPQ